MLDYQQSSFTASYGDNANLHTSSEKRAKSIAPINQSALRDSYSDDTMIFERIRFVLFHDSAKKSDTFQNKLLGKFRDELTRDLRHVLEEEAIEAGMIHRGEMILERAIQLDASHALRAIEQIVSDEEMPELARNVLWLLANVSIPDSDWKLKLIKNALESKSNGLREAAIRAVENWEGEMFVQQLKSHRDSVPWIREYCEDVIQDLSE